MTGADDTLRRRVQQSIDRALEFLHGEQAADGSFPLSYWSEEPEPTSPDQIFGAATIMLAVGNLLSAPSRRAVLELVLRTRNERGSWHWDRARCYAPDADDTACALAVLTRLVPEQVEDSAMEGLAPFLYPDGRIATWVPEIAPALSTDDVVVVANVLYSMALQDRTEAKEALARWWTWSALRHHRCLDPARGQLWLAHWLGRLMASRSAEPGEPADDAAAASADSGRPATRYYVPLEAVGYSWARLLRALQLTVPAPVFPPERRQSPLHSSLASIAGNGRGGDLVSYLLATQSHDGSWPAEPWCSAPGTVFGSAAVTTAFAVETLYRHLSRLT